MHSIYNRHNYNDHLINVYAVLSCSVLSNSFVTSWTVAHQAPLSMGILQSVLDWVAMPSSRGSSQPRHQTQVSCIAGRFLTSWAINVNASSLMKDDFISREGIGDTR